MREKIKQLDLLKAKGAHYVDARWYPREDSNFLFMWNGNLKENNASSQSGIGVRVLYNGAWGFSASSDLSDPDAIFERAFDNARIASERVTFPIRLAEKKPLWVVLTAPTRSTLLLWVWIKRWHSCKKWMPRLTQTGVIQRFGMLEFVRKQIIFLDSEGSEIEKNIIEVFPSIHAMGIDKDGGMQRRKYAPGRSGPTRGWESINEADFLANAERIVSELNQVLVAEDVSLPFLRAKPVKMLN